MRGFPTAMAAAIPTKTQVTAPQSTTGAFGLSVPVQTVTLVPGASASALIEWSPTGYVAGGSCVWVAEFSTTPPGGKVPTTVGRGGLGKVCDMHVLPVVAGATHDGYVVAPEARTTLGLVTSQTKVADGYRVVLTPATRQSDGQFVAIPGSAPITYQIPGALVPDGGVTLVGAIEVTVRGPQVTFLTILGG